MLQYDMKKYCNVLKTCSSSTSDAPQWHFPLVWTLLGSKHLKQKSCLPTDSFGAISNAHFSEPAFAQPWPRLSEHHPKYEGTSIFTLIQSWASAETTLVKVPCVKMAL